MVLNTDGRNPFMSIEADERFTELNDTLSIGAFIENMLLEAESLGIGSLWVGNTCFAYSELTAYMETKEQLIGAVALGYADESPSQRPRIPFESIVEFIN
jgi:nitroreductase